MNISLIEFPTEHDWDEVYRRCLITIDKKPIKHPSDEWKRKLLLARHSPIRRLRFAFLIEGIPSYCSVHLCRHVHAQPYVKSQRNDRQSEYDRNTAPQSYPVNMIYDLNAESLMNVAEKRLCSKADETTRKIVQMMCNCVESQCPEFEGLLAPPCELYGKCFEMFPCGKLNDTAKWVHGENHDICSNCGYMKPIIVGENINQPPSNYCPNCGKRMV